MESKNGRSFATIQKLNHVPRRYPWSQSSPTWTGRKRFLSRRKGCCWWQVIWDFKHSFLINFFSFLHFILIKLFEIFLVWPFSLIGSLKTKPTLDLMPCMSKKLQTVFKIFCIFIYVKTITQRVGTWLWVKNKFNNHLKIRLKNFLK